MPFPVVVAPFGLTLGGGAEMTLHASRVQAHAELYVGLVEVGVGLIPAGGGTKELLFRFTEELAAYEEADPFEAVKRAFKMIAMATTSTSALDARKLGFLRDGDRISMNRDHLLGDAKARVLEMARDYVAPPPRRIRALGREAIGNLEYAIWAMHEARSGQRSRRAHRPRARARARWRRRSAARGVRAGRARPRARGVSLAARHEGDAAADRAHAQDREAAEKLVRDDSETS